MGGGCGAEYLRLFRRVEAVVAIPSRQIQSRSKVLRRPRGCLSALQPHRGRGLSGTAQKERGNAGRVAQTQCRPQSGRGKAYAAVRGNGRANGIPHARQCALSKGGSLAAAAFRHSHQVSQTDASSLQRGFGGMAQLQGAD